MIAHITIPVFSSPTSPIGALDGRISLKCTPKMREPLAWAELITDAAPELLSILNTGRVEYLDTAPQIKSVEVVVGLDGVYLDSEVAAREFARELESRLGLVYVNY